MLSMLTPAEHIILWAAFFITGIIAGIALSYPLTSGGKKKL